MWRRPCRHPHISWPREIDTNVQSVISGFRIHSAWRKATDNMLWQRIADRKHPSRGMPLKKKDNNICEIFSEHHCDDCTSASIPSARWHVSILEVFCDDLVVEAMHERYDEHFVE